MKEPSVAIAVFASGRGSNFQAIDAALSQQDTGNDSGPPPAAITLCVSNNPNPGAFDYARSRGIETLRLSPRMFPTEAEYAMVLLQSLQSRSIEMIALTGYMRRLPEAVVTAYSGRILNIHPALLPRFGGQGMYGMHVHEAVLAAGETESGATVHLVDGDYDTGEIIAQQRVPVIDGDTPETLAARVLSAEHELYPRVVIERTRNIRSEHTTLEAKQTDERSTD